MTRRPDDKNLVKSGETRRLDELSLRTPLELGDRDSGWQALRALTRPLSGQRFELASPSAMPVYDGK